MRFSKSSFEKLKVLLIFLLFSAGLDRLHSNSAGNPEPVGRTGSPGDGQSCNASGCHAAVSRVPAFSLSGISSGYSAGATYNLTLTPSGPRGFEIVAEADASNQSVGSWSAGSNNQASAGGGLKHVGSGVGAASWSFAWTAPPTNVGNVTFYMAGPNAAAGSDSATYLNSFSLAAPAASTTSPAVPSLSGVAHSTGSISWSWAAVARADSYRLETSTAGFVSSFSSATLSFTETGLGSATAFTRRVVAVNSAGESPSAYVTAATPQQALSVLAASTAAFTVQGATVSVPSALFGAGVNGTILVSVDPAGKPLSADSPSGIQTADASLTGGLRRAPGALFEFLASTGSGRFAVDFSAPATLALAYPDSNGDGLVDGTSISADTLKMVSWDSGQTAWSDVPSNVRDAAGKKVTASAGRFSVFALVGIAAGNDLTDVHIYPNPLRPSQGHSSMNFTHLPAGAAVRVYTLAGEFMSELQANASGIAVWNGRNSSGMEAASGAYLAVVAAGGGRRVFTVAVQR
ncbi:MAG: hypothetical protein A3G41_00815 [Elusimicrobia bacterium RIFCSPLOWO2_12_FULL_59_9]|nr:MAG: hypothetical protein A3G41_00815 [Elusimicrobia bacterium RIFCSPLOWO2_12_FULL_59_9]